MGEYGEGFLGIGYSHPSSFGASATTETHPNAASCDNNSSQYRYRAENDSQPVFVAAQIYKDKNSLGEQQQISCQVQEQLEEDAGLAQSKSKDILRNILHGIDSTKANASPRASFQSNESNEYEADTLFNNNSTENQQNNNNYYGPQANFVSTSHGTSNTTEITQIPTTPSIESEAQAARMRAIDIIRKFQSQPNGNDNTIESEAQAARMKAIGILRKFQSQRNGNGNADSTGASTINTSSAAQPTALSSLTSHYEPQEMHSATSDTLSVHLIPQQSHHPPQPIPSQSQSPITPSIIPVKVSVATAPPWEHARRRRESLQKDEERKQRALFKNLQYVARVEEERLAKQLVEVQQVKTLEQQIDERYQQKMEYRIKKRSIVDNGSNNINTSGAGIGTKQRRKAEAKRQKNALPPTLSHKYQGNRGGNSNHGSRKTGGDSVAIYVSNLPTDDSIDEATVQGLFSAYGSLRKIHFYVDKVTGEKKGDAVVIYSLTEGEDENALTESVCSQVCI